MRKKVQILDLLHITRQINVSGVVFLTEKVGDLIIIIIAGDGTKEIKNAPECIVELYRHAGIFKNTRKVHREA